MLSIRIFFQEDFSTDDFVAKVNHEYSCELLDETPQSVKLKTQGQILESVPKSILNVCAEDYFAEMARRQNEKLTLQAGMN
jgi:hypothetical protein